MRVWLNQRAKRGATGVLGCLALFAHTNLPLVAELLVRLSFRFRGSAKRDGMYQQLLASLVY